MLWVVASLNLLRFFFLFFFFMFLCTGNFVVLAGREVKRRNYLYTIFFSRILRNIYIYKHFLELWLCVHFPLSSLNDSSYLQIRNYRTDWDLEVNQPIAGNYYPVSFSFFQNIFITHFFGLFNKIDLFIIVV
jgi:hypothetical protein